MRFVDKLTDLQRIHSDNSVVQVNGTKLAGISVQGSNLAEHYIYAPMSTRLRAILINSYNRTVPAQLLKFYEAANGCDLFWTSMEIGRRKIKIPMAQLSVYGVPAGNSTVDSIEPHNISVEDLDRPADTPESWLKIGSYRHFGQEKLTEYDLFTNVDSGSVHSVIRKAESCRVEQTWESVDDCLCNLFEAIQYRAVNLGNR